MDGDLICRFILPELGEIFDSGGLQQLLQNSELRVVASGLGEQISIEHGIAEA